MSASDIAAWWGAILATAVLGWDIYKWVKSGAQLRISASANMQTLNQAARKLEDDKLIFVEAANNGDRPTTITSLFVKHYKSWFHRLVNRPAMQAIVPLPGGAQPIPFKLDPGHRWTGLIDQKDIEEKGGVGGLLYCGIHHTASEKPAMVRVHPK